MKQSLQVVAPPGHLKSTALLIHMAQRLLNEDASILHGTMSPDLSKGTTDWLQHVIHQMYGAQGVLWQAQQFTVPGWDPIRRFPSFYSATTFKKFEGERFDECYGDDFENIDSMWSELIREKTYQWYNLQYRPRLADGGLARVNIGSFWHRDDLLNQEIRKGVLTHIYPMFFSKRPACFNDDAGKPLENVVWHGEEYSHLWPAKWGAMAMTAKRWEMEVGAVEFGLRYMCDPTAVQSEWFPESSLHYWQDDPTFMNLTLPRLRLVVADDPNLTEREIKGTSEHAIQVGAWQWSPPKVYQLESYSGRWNEQKEMETIDGILERWAPVARGIEEWIVEESSASEHYIRKLENYRTPHGHLVPVTRQPPIGGSKDTRILSVSHHTGTQRLLLSRDDHKTHAQLRGFPTKKEKDLADCLEMLIRPVLSDTPRRSTGLEGIM